jgi:hypothetical protein
LVGSIPPKGLTKVRGYKSSNDPEYRRQNEPGRFVITGRNEFGDHASDKPDDDRPKNMHT